MLPEEPLMLCFSVLCAGNTEYCLISRKNRNWSLHECSNYELLCDSHSVRYVMYCLIYSSPQPSEVLLPPLLTGGETETDEVVKSHLMIGDKIMMLIWICPSPET